MAGRSAPPEADKSAKASRQGVIAPLIVESEAGPLGGDVVESLGGHSCHPRKVEAPDALCAADHPYPLSPAGLAQPEAGRPRASNLAAY